MINKAPINAKPIRAIPSPITMLDRFTGVAKKRLITSVWRRLKNTKAVPNTPVLNKEKPNWPGRIKSIVLYSRPVMVLSRISATDGFKVLS
ncbi:hypothetical protein D3C85_1409570 [compost metagenome]